MINGAKVKKAEELQKVKNCLYIGSDVVSAFIDQLNIDFVKDYNESDVVVISLPFAVSSTIYEEDIIKRLNDQQNAVKKSVRSPVVALLTDISYSSISLALKVSPMAIVSIFDDRFIVEQVILNPPRKQRYDSPTVQRKILELQRAREVLTGIQLEILKLTAEGLTNKQIADELCISESTLKSYRKNILNKLCANTFYEAIAKAYAMGWLKF